MSKDKSSLLDYSGTLAIAVIFLVAVTASIFFLTKPNPLPQAASDPRLLSDPFLQLPTETSVRVVWFTEFPGTNHAIAYGNNLQQTAIATTRKLTRVREDQKSRVGPQAEDRQLYSQPIGREIWRHEGEVTGLKANRRIPYQVRSIREDGEEIRSGIFSLAPTPKPGRPLKILLTSDHQLMPMTAANLQKAAETVGRVDAVFLAGDLTNIPDRASEWFDDNRGGAFFPCLQGRANYNINGTVYRGGELIQHAPLYTAIGNHEVMGQYSSERGLNYQFSNPVPRGIAAQNYDLAAKQINPRNDPKVRQAWIAANSFNTDTYEEIFTLPQSISGGEKYYAVTFGDIRLISLFITNIWRSPSLEKNAKGRYQESQQDLGRPGNWGYGQHIFEPIAKGSEQYQWLVKELNRPEFQQAKYKIVMFHHPAHSLGDNIVPAYTNPVASLQRDREGRLQSVRYEYPLKDDYIIRDIEPLLTQAGVQLAYYGHSHLWNRFVSDRGLHFLESSNVGNTYGAYWQEKKRAIPPGYRETYAAIGDPNGLEPIVPTIAPLTDKNDRPLPYIASNDISVFSILETPQGTVSSYRFDSRDPNAEVVKFDEFSLF